jgi:hypothetical protein
LLHYQIKEKGEGHEHLKWSEMFKKMEELKEKHSILEDYTLSETTLEQVFLSFAQLKNQPVLEGLDTLEESQTTRV